MLNANKPVEADQAPFFTLSPAFSYTQTLSNMQWLAPAKHHCLAIFLTKEYNKITPTGAITLPFYLRYKAKHSKFVYQAVQRARQHD